MCQCVRLQYVLPSFMCGFISLKFSFFLKQITAVCSKKRGRNYMVIMDQHSNSLRLLYGFLLKRKKKRIVHPQLKCHLFPCSPLRRWKALVTFSSPTQPVWTLTEGKNSTQCRYIGSVWWPCTQMLTRNRTRVSICSCGVIQVLGRFKSPIRLQKLTLTQCF